MTEKHSPIGTYFPPGTLVRLNLVDDHEPELGIVVHCWIDGKPGFEFFDCYVAFFGVQLPDGKPKEIPYVLRYSSTSLVVVGSMHPD